MKITPTFIQGVYIIEPKVFKDSRGYFFESYRKEEFEKTIGKVDFVQDNESCSTKGVIRGLHFQKPPHCQAKLVRCILGKVLDVAVDLREGSPTYGKHIAVEISDENHLEFYIPKGFAHGFEVLSDMAIFQYKCDEYYHPESEGGIDLFDQDLGIDWQTPLHKTILSEKDKKNPRFSEFETPFR